MRFLTSSTGKASVMVRLSVSSLFLCLCFAFCASLPVNATSSTYNLGDYNLYNQANGTPSTQYRIGGGDFSSNNETGVYYSPALFGNTTNTPLVIRMRMRGSNNTMPELISPSLIEYQVVTNNLTWRGSANVSTDFLPLGCELSGSVGAYSAWSCIGINSDVASGGSSHFIFAGNWWSLTDINYNAYIMVVDWRQYKPEGDGIDYTQLLTDIRNNTADTATVSQQIRNQLVSLNTTTTNIYSILQTMNDRLQSVNQSATNEAQQDAQDRSDIQAQQTSTQNSANSSAQSVQNATSSLSSNISSIVGAFSSPATDCLIPVNDVGPDGVLDLGNLNICSVPDDVRSFIRTVTSIVITVAVLLISFNVINQVVALIEEFYGTPGGKLWI